MKSPVYLDNIIFSLQKVGGISIYWLELLKRLNACATNIGVFERDNACDNLFRGNLKGTLAICQECCNLPLQMMRYLPVLSRLHKPSIFHSSYYRFSLQRQVANIVTVYDFTYERFRSGLPKFVHSLQKKMAFAQADGIICISESTKKDLLFFHPEIKCKNIQVIYMGVSHAFYVLAETPVVSRNMQEIISKKYIVFVGARAGYKNFEIAVSVVSRLPGCHLLIIGGGDLLAGEISLLGENLPGRFWHWQGVSDSDLNIFYNYAFCLLYPSGYEGFGIPVIESMAAGCPVVAVDNSSIPEVSGAAALLVDEPNVDAFVDNIKRLEDDLFRQQTIEMGVAHSSKFTWDSCFEQTKLFYKQVFEGKFNLPFH